MAKTKSELLAEAEGLGLDVNDGMTKAELEAALASGEALGDGGVPVGDVPPAIDLISKLDAPTEPLPGTPVEAAAGEHEPIGVAQPDLEAPTSEVGVDPVVERGPLAATPAESTRHDNVAARVEDGA